MRQAVVSGASDPFRVREPFQANKGLCGEQGSSSKWLTGRRRAARRLSARCVAQSTPCGNRMVWRTIREWANRGGRPFGLEGSGFGLPLAGAPSLMVFKGGVLDLISNARVPHASVSRVGSLFHAQGIELFGRVGDPEFLRQHEAVCSKVTMPKVPSSRIAVRMVRFRVARWRQARQRRTSDRIAATDTRPWPGSKG